MNRRIAVETLTLAEISDLFQKSLESAFPKAKGAVAATLRKLKKTGINSHKWVKTYEEYKGAKLHFYCEKFVSQESPVVSIGMTYRTLKGLILITADVSNGGFPVSGLMEKSSSARWVRIFTGHFCERFAERIMLASQPSFQEGSKGIMFSDMMGPVRITDTIAEGIDEIEFQFKDGQAYGYRDSKSRITYFRTVYSNDMLKRERLDFKNEWKQPLEELYEIFKWK